MQKKVGLWKNIFGTLAFCNRHKALFLSTAIFLQMATLIGKEVLRSLFQLILVLSDLPSIDQYNFRYFFSNPENLALALLFALIFAFFFFIEVFTLVQVIFAAREGKQISYRQILLHSFTRLRDLSFANFPLFLLYILCTVPVSGILLHSSLMSSFQVPDFITEELEKTAIGSISVFLISLLFIYINLRMIYTVPLMGMKNQKFRLSLKESFHYTKKGCLRLLFTISVFEFLLGILSNGLLLLMVFLFTFLDPSGQIKILHFLLYLIFRFIRFFFVVLSKIGVLSLLVNTLPDENLPGESHFVTTRKYGKWSVFAALLLMIGYGISSLFDFLGSDVNTNLQIIAHRGYTEHAVENTLSSLEAAKKAGADRVELDIQLTKDNDFVVMHDFNLHRLTGVRKRVSDCTLRELTSMTLHENGATAPIPSFEAFVKKAQELHIPLLIEIKPTGREPSNFPKILLSKLREYGVGPENDLMSLDIPLMEEIEKEDPKWNTGVVIPLQFGDFPTKGVDFYAIEDSSYRPVLMKEAEKEHKQVFVWTINERDKILKYLQSPVNGIITDDPLKIRSLVRNLAEDHSYLGMYERYIF